MGGLSRARTSAHISSLESEQKWDGTCNSKRDGSEGQMLEPTGLYLPPASKQDPPFSQRLYLPRRHRVDSAPGRLDQYLSQVPRIASRALELQTLCESEEEKQWNDTEEEQTLDPFLQKAASSRCLNVLQGEMAHTSASQTDVVISAEATTCHVVALRSTTQPQSSEVSGSNSGTEPLVSMAHIDKPGYDHCLEQMLLEHIQHHSEQKKQQQQQSIDQEGREDDGEYGFFFEDWDNGDGAAEEEPKPAAPIDMELHMVGGYCDEEGTSQELSASLVETFSRLAEKYSDRLRISLSTAAISSLNDTATTIENENPASAGSPILSSSAPRSRGLGIDTHTGDVFPIKSALPAELEGPAMEVRSARGWAQAMNKGNQQQQAHQEDEQLYVIHDRMSKEGQVKVLPYRYSTHNRTIDALLRVPDDVLLHYTSTSPKVESERFCSDLRRTLSFVNTTPPEQVFGATGQEKPLVYTRSLNQLNGWDLVST